MAIQRQRPAPGLIHHSDQGSQYAAADYCKALNEAGLVRSMQEGQFEAERPKPGASFCAC
jgi:transposase InsO family protein